MMNSTSFYVILGSNVVFFYHLLLFSIVLHLSYMDMLKILVNHLNAQDSILYI